jgi:hypothetical protein
MTALPSTVARKWTVNVVLSRQAQGRVAHAQSIYCSKDEGDGSVTCIWQSDSVHAIVSSSGAFARARASACAPPPRAHRAG